MGRLRAYVLLLKECVRIVATLILGVAFGGVVWYSFFYAAGWIVVRAFPPSNGGAVTAPSIPSCVLLLIAMVAFPFVLIAGGWFGWHRAVKPHRHR